MKKTRKLAVLVAVALVLLAARVYVSIGKTN